MATDVIYENQEVVVLSGCAMKTSFTGIESLVAVKWMREKSYSQRQARSILFILMSRYGRFLFYTAHGSPPLQVSTSLCEEGEHYGHAPGSHNPHSLRFLEVIHEVVCALCWHLCPSRVIDPASNVLTLGGEKLTEIGVSHLTVGWVEASQVQHEAAVSVNPERELFPAAACCQSCVLSRALGLYVVNAQGQNATRDFLSLHFGLGPKSNKREDFRRHLSHI